MNLIINKYLRNFFLLSTFFCVVTLATEDMKDSNSESNSTSLNKRKAALIEPKKNSFKPNKEARSSKATPARKRNKSLQEGEDIQRSHPQDGDNDWVQEAEAVMNYLEERDRIESGEYNEPTAQLDH